MKASLKTKLYGAAEGPLGFPMADDAAKELENIWKGLPKECKDMGLLHISKAADGMDFAEDERADISFITTNSLDRDREVLLAEGGDWTSFRKNPVVTFAHNYDELPLGKAAWVKKDSRGQMSGWLAKTIYKSRPENWPHPWFPDAVWEYVKEKYLPGKSIGFIAMDFRAPTEKEILANPAWAKARGVIPKWMALEYAVTPVQSNPDALVQGVSKLKAKGIRMTEEFMANLGLVLPEHPPGIDSLSAADLEEPARKAADPPLPSPPLVPLAPPNPAHVMTGSKYQSMVAAQLAASLKGFNVPSRFMPLRRGEV